MEEQNIPQTEPQEKKPSFVDRLKLRELAQSPIRKWLAWAGIVFLIALIIAYYLTTGGN